MKIYTRTGDDGTTGLFGGPRVSKDSSRIEAYGTVDELNSILGMVRSALPITDPWGAEQITGEGARPDSVSSRLDALHSWLDRIQSELFDLGADLATPMDGKASVVRISGDAAERLESDIDRMEENLEPLKAFILPSGHEAATRFHLARTVCRRAERRVISLAQHEDINAHCVVYLNRLSDALFTAARAVNAATGTKETEWKPSGQSTETT